MQLIWQPCNYSIGNSRTFKCHSKLSFSVKSLLLVIEKRAVQSSIGIWLITRKPLELHLKLFNDTATVLSPLFIKQSSNKLSQKKFFILCHKCIFPHCCGLPVFQAHASAKVTINFKLNIYCQRKLLSKKKKAAMQTML